MSIVQRGKTWHLRRRVPKRYDRVEKRGTVWVSLGTDSESVARNKADRVWQEFVEGWEARLAGDTDDADARFAAAQELAWVQGFRYLDVRKVAGLPLNRLLERVEVIPKTSGEPDTAVAAAVLGTIPEPMMTVSRALEAYWVLARDKTLGKSDDQIRRWKNPRFKAIRNFIEVVGDRPIDEITRDDLLEFRQFWADRMEADGLTANSANKDLIHLGEVLKTINRMKRFGLDFPLGELSFKEGERRTRPPFSTEWIRSRILPPEALAGLNADARGILLGMVNTGYRPSEGAALTEETIRLDGPVPYISIEPRGRQLKSVHARRQIPLTGVSLEAFRANPAGFPRYRDSSASLDQR